MLAGVSGHKGNYDMKLFYVSLCILGTVLPYINLSLGFWKMAFPSGCFSTRRSALDCPHLRGSM